MNEPRPLSRRDFVGLAALGLLGAGCMTRRAERGVRPSSDGSELLWVGTYTEAGRAEGIFRLQLDTGTGALRQVGAHDAGPNPSFLALHPNGDVLYAVNEVTDWQGQATGAVSAFGVAADGALARLGEMRASGGGAPCYVSVDQSGRWVLVANYVGGSVALLPVDAGGALVAASYVERHQGTGPNPTRQEAPHAHCILPDPTGRWVLATDLGTDQVLVYRVDTGGRAPRLLLRGSVRMKPGAGPRHLAFHPSLPLVFVANELDSTVTALRWDAIEGTLSVTDTHSTLPPGWSGANQVADIHVGPLGRALYVSNRGHDSIAVFSVAPAGGALAQQQVVSTGGRWPRNFGLDPSGRWLLVANQRSNDITVFARDATTGHLTPAGASITVPSPVCLRFARPATS